MPMTQMSLLDWAPPVAAPLAAAPKRSPRGTIKKLIPRQTSKFVVYALRDPLTMAIRYVGATGDLIARMYGHFCKSRNGKIAASSWIAETKRKTGLYPVVEILSGHSSDHATALAEQRAIDTLRAAGHDLLNSEKSMMYADYKRPTSTVRFPDGSEFEQRAAPGGVESSALAVTESETAATFAIKTAMLAAGISLTTLGNATGTSYQVVGNVLLGKNPPGLRLSLALSRLFLLAPRDFLVPPEPMAPPKPQKPRVGQVKIEQSKAKEMMEWLST